LEQIQLLNLKTIYIFSFVLSIFFGCSKDKTSACTSFPTFSQEIEQVFITNCMPCHQTNNANGGVILENHSTISNNINASILQIEAATMPPSTPLNDSIISLLNCWVENGKKND